MRLGVVNLFRHEGHGVPGIVGKQGLGEGDSQPGQETHPKGLTAGHGLDQWKEMGAAAAAAQPGHDQRHQGGHFQNREQVLHEGPFPDAADVHARQQGDHPAGHQLGRVELKAEQAVGHVGLGDHRQQFAQGNPCQHVGLSETGHQHAEVLGEGNRHGGIEAVLDDQELRPAEEERPEVAVGLAEEDVLSPGMRIHGSQLRTGDRAEHGEQAAEYPQADEQPRRLDPLGHDRQPDENARADHRADHDGGRIE